LIYEFSRFIRKTWLGKWRVYNPKDLVYFLNTIFPQYKGFGFHDPFVTVIITGFKNKSLIGNLEILF